MPAGALDGPGGATCSGAGSGTAPCSGSSPPCRPRPKAEPPGGITAEPDDRGPGRSRGGLTTKLHLAVEQGQEPMSIVITVGQRGDSPQFEPA
ncbi:hypothetical protein AB0D11_35955 [Streptomyces monashensis]|uniref:hypothetical protein n=1 Tax=Streptomyces monashensis TaxID=1678012 RepID=UPI0033C5CF2B